MYVSTHETKFCEYVDEHAASFCIYCELYRYAAKVKKKKGYICVFAFNISFIE